MVDDLKQQQRLRELILLAKNGDAGAFEEVYTAYYTPLFHYIVTRIKDRQEAEDMTQTVFMKIWNSIPTWNESHTSPLAFFFTVARNMMIDYFRKSSHKEIVSDLVVSSFAESHGTIESGSELRELMTQAVRKLSEEQREIINLLYVNDLSYKEIAVVTGKREDAIRQIHSRAIKKLREIYEH